MTMPTPVLGIIRSWQELGPLRFVAVALMVLAWVIGGYYLLRTATYPARCPGLSLFGLYECSFELPRTRGWRESGLFVWLWSTPILFGLEVSRRMQRTKWR
jgi:hypothetical protein